MIIDIGNFKQTGEYRLVVRKAITHKISRKTSWLKNLVTNRGVDAAMSITAYNGPSLMLAVGTGSLAPLPTDLYLQSFLAGSNVTPTEVRTTNFTNEPYYIQRTMSVTFNQGEVVGNVSEMGWAIGSGRPTATTQLYNRSLIVNANGDPITVTVLADEYLTVEWRFRLMIPKLVQGQVPVNIKGVQTMQNFEMLPIRVNEVPGNLYTSGWGFTSYIGSIQNLYPYISPNDGYEKTRLYTGVTARPDITARRPGNNGNVSTNNADQIAVAAYTTGAKRREVTLKWTLTRGNVSGINAFMIDFYIGVFCIWFPTFSFDKTSNDQLELTIRWGLDN